MIDPLNTMLGQYAADKALPDAPTSPVIDCDSSDIPTEDFDRLLVDIIEDVLDDYGTGHLFGWPGFKEILSAAFVEEIRERWEQEKADEKDAENPYEHDSSYDGCTVDCKACAWEVENL